MNVTSSLLKLPVLSKSAIFLFVAFFCAFSLDAKNISTSACHLPPGLGYGAFVLPPGLGGGGK